MISANRTFSRSNCTCQLEKFLPAVASSRHRPATPQRCSAVATCPLRPSAWLAHSSVTSATLGRQCVRSTLRCMASSQAGTISREVLGRGQRQKLDPDDDRNFYSLPRFVNHVDDHFIKSITALYRQRVPPNSTVLDMMSSHVSHLPPDISYAKVIGHGLNAQELAKNPRLDSSFVRNLNLDPSGWALADSSIDAVTCCVSVQYLQQPEKVFAEVYRVLKPGGVAIFSFSNRMFYTKAVRAWTDNSEYGRVSLVKQYFQCIEGFTPAEEVEEVDTSQDQPQGLAAFVSKLQGFSQNDPFYAVISYKEFKPDLESVKK